MDSIEEQHKLIKFVYPKLDLFPPLPEEQSFCGKSCATSPYFSSGHGAQGLGIVVSKDKKHPVSETLVSNRYKINPHTVEFKRGRYKYYAHVITKHINDVKAAHYNDHFRALKDTKTDTSCLNKLHHAFLYEMMATFSGNFKLRDWGKIRDINCSDAKMELYKEQSKGKTVVFLFNTKKDRKYFDLIVSKLNGKILWECEHTNSTHDDGCDYLTSAIVRF